MKKIFPSALAIFFSLFLSANKPQLFSNNQHKSSVAFKENKGQVRDQNYNFRRDILYSGTAGHINFFLKKNGISYQQWRVNSYIQHPIEKDRKIAGSTTLYRIDVDWLNTNSNGIITGSNTLPGYDNYVTAGKAAEINNVKSYNKVVYENIYNGINLHYYSVNGKLKYDYLIDAGADYKQIKTKINGATDLFISATGELHIKTPLGTIVEGLPLVIQNKKILKSKWVLHNNIITYEISGIDKTQPFVIDPVVRIWGSYYGTTSPSVSEFMSNVTDNSGNIFYSGTTNILNSALIATAGAYQTTYGGGVNDAFITKFDANGNRLWATYYGGSDYDSGTGITRDQAGNIFMCGVTGSTLTGIMSSAGSFQDTYGGGTYDAYLAKFDQNGLRIWSTFYGGTGQDMATSCTTDSVGNVYMSGSTNSSSATVIATSGCHQPTMAGTYDYFLAKFNNNGNRIWGTYYGGLGNEQNKTYCTTDKWNNVYLSGTTNSSDSISIATAGSHQTSLAGYMNSFVAKFTPAGIRKWSTYYGGAYYEYANACTVDNNGNVFLVGSASSTLANAVATNGSHQQTYGGGNSDGYIVKFDSVGSRLWGTYYGGNLYDSFLNAALDTAGNIYLVGFAESAGGTVIATPNSYQTSFAGGSTDVMLVKFNTNGVRQWGTYYGGIYQESAPAIAYDGNGNIYIGGRTQSTNSVFASPGSYQTALATGFLARFHDCPVTPLSINASSGSISCQGQSVTLTASPGAVTYTWNNGSNSTSITVAPIYNTTYTVTGTNSSGCVNGAILSLTVLPTPTMNVFSSNSNQICPGYTTVLTATGAVTSYTWNGGVNSNTMLVNPSSVTIYTVAGTGTNNCVVTKTYTINMAPVPAINITGNPIICSGKSTTLTASGAITYTWNTASNNTLIVVTPTTNTTYIVSGNNVWNCTGTQTITVTVNPSPLISVSGNTLICNGNSTTLTASGANTFTWSNGATANSIIVNPPGSTSYTVNGTGANGCVGKKIVPVVVSTLPTLTLSTSDSLLCIGQTATITAGGNGTLYVWNTLDTGQVITVSPSVTTVYTINVTGSAGCTRVDSIIQNVGSCIGIRELINENGNIIVYPNPGKGTYNLQINGDYEISTIEVFNSLGQLIHSKLQPKELIIDITTQPKGIYVFRIKSETQTFLYKVILE